MKKLFILLLFFGVSVPLIAQKEPLEIKMFFSSRDDAEKAFLSGNFRYYQPNPDNLRAKPPRLAKGLPCAYVALEDVRENKEKSPAWVLLPSAMPAEFNSNGTPIVDGRCWNGIKEAYPVEKYVSLSMVGKLYGPPGKDGRTPIKGIDYFDGEDGINGKDGEVIYEEPSDSSCSSWTTGKTLLVATGTAIGAVGGGFAFMVTEIIKGISFRTSDGPWFFGPDMKEKHFNVPLAIISGIVIGGIIYLLIN